jgi:hypothetical protein
MLGGLGNVSVQEIWKSHLFPQNFFGTLRLQFFIAIGQPVLTTMAQQ